MSRYRRMRVPGGTYFFTVMLAQRGSDALVRQVEVLRQAVRATRAERPFRIEAWVVMPDHLHAVWTLPEGDADFSVRWGAIKSRFSRRVGVHATGAPDADGVPIAGSGRVGTSLQTAAQVEGFGRVGTSPTLRSSSKVRKQESGVWQRRFWEHSIRDAEDFAAHVDYCHWNPVKHGYVARPEDWAWSSVHREKVRVRIAKGGFQPADAQFRSGDAWVHASPYASL